MGASSLGLPSPISQAGPQSSALPLAALKVAFSLTEVLTLFEYGELRQLGPVRGHLNLGKSWSIHTALS